MLRVLDLFSGIGGFSLGLEATKGFETISFCEIDPFCRKVLAKHWPNVPCFEDITKLNEEELNGLGNIDVICGGFPCQDISCAGKGAGIHAARSGLWWEMLRIIRLVRPRYVLVENVAALLNRGLDEVLGSLAESGYDAEWGMLKASYFGALHRRERVFIIAHDVRKRCEPGRNSDGKDDKRICDGERCSTKDLQEGRNIQHQSSQDSPIVFTNDLYQRIQRFREKEIQGQRGFSWCKDVRRIEDLRGRPNILEPLISRENDGFRGRVDRLKSLGNAVCPPVVQYVAECVLAYEESNQKC